MGNTSIKAIEKYIYDNRGLLSLLGVFAAISALFLTIPNPNESLRRIQFLFLILFFFTLVFAAGRSLIWSHKNDTLANSLFSITFFLATFEVGKMLYVDYSEQLHVYLLEPAVLAVILLGISQHINNWYNKFSFTSPIGKLSELILSPLSFYLIFILQRIYLLFARKQDIEWSIFGNVLSDTYLYLLLNLSFLLLMFISHSATKRFVFGMIIVHVLVLVIVIISKFVNI